MIGIGIATLLARTGRRLAGPPSMRRAGSRAVGLPLPRQCGLAQPGLPAARKPARRIRPRRRRRSRQGRADQALRGRRRASNRPSSTGWASSRSGRAARAAASSRCSADSRRNAARSTIRSSRCARTSTARSARSSGCRATAASARGSGAASWLRSARTIAARNIANTRPAGRAAFSRTCSAAAGILRRHRMRRWRAPTGRCACAAATASTSRSPIPPCRASSPTTSGFASACARPTEATLYSHRNPGEDVARAVSTSGRSYSELPTAFSYRKQFNAACSCRAPGQSWADALRQGDDQTVERGDIVVTEERARQLSQPRFDAQGKPVNLGPTSGRPAPKSAEAVSAAPLPPAGAAKPAAAAHPPRRKRSRKSPASARCARSGRPFIRCGNGQHEVRAPIISRPERRVSLYDLSRCSRAPASSCASRGLRRYTLLVAVSE